MPFNEQIFCELLQQKRLTFEQMSAQLASLKQESNGKAVIRANTQAIIHESLRNLLSGFAGEATQVDWILPVSFLTLSNWVVGLSVFASGDKREALLKDTAVLLERLPDAAQGGAVMMRSAALALQNMQDSDGVRSILREITRQLAGRPVALESATLSDILYSLQKQSDSDTVRALLHALLPYFIKAKERKTWLSPAEIGRALYGLQCLPAIPEVNRILSEIARHILAVKAQDKLMVGKSLGMAFYGLRNMRPCAEVEEVIQALHTHLPTQMIEMDTFCHILYGLRYMQDSVAAGSILAALIPHLHGYIRAESAFNPRQLNLMLESLGELVYFHVAIMIYELLLPQTIAACAELDRGALGRVFVLLEFLPDSAQTQQWRSMLAAFVLKRIQNLRKPLDSATITHLLCSIRTLPFSAEISQILAGLGKHLDKNAQAGQRLSNMGVIHALQGLQDFTESEEIKHILTALTRHIPSDISSSWTLSSKRRWLAEIIYSLRQHFSGQNATVAKQLVQAAAGTVGLAPDMERLHENDLMDQIISLGQFIAALPDGGIQLYVTNSSTSLAQALCRHLLARKQRGEIRRLTIVFAPQAEPNSAAKRYFYKKKYMLLQSMLNGERCDGRTPGRVTVMETGVIRGVRRKASALQPAAQTISATQPGPARKRIKTEPVSFPVTRVGENVREVIDVDEETDAEEETGTGEEIIDLNLITSIEEGIDLNN